MKRRLNILGLLPCLLLVTMVSHVTIADWSLAPKSADPWLSRQGVRSAPGTRVRPQGVPENWRISGTRELGGTRYYDPTNPGHSVRVMQGSPTSPYPNSQAPYVRWQYHGQPLDVNGNVLPTARTPDAHIPLQDFRFIPEVYPQ
jgi:hypothetical protein